MRWLKFIFDQYLDDTAEPVVIKEVDNIEVNVSVGDLYAVSSLYYVVADTEEYPYEVFMASPYWELASHKDLIVDGRQRRWAVLSIPRYATDGIIAQSLKFDQISPVEVEIIRSYLYDNGVLPQSMTGLSYKEGDESFQELFRKRETNRSRVLLVDVLEQSE